MELRVFKYLLQFALLCSSLWSIDECHSFALNPDQIYPSTTFSCFRKKVKVWTWNSCASHEAIEKAREWGPRLVFLLIFQQTFQVRLMLLVTAQAAWVTQFSDPFLLPLHLPVPTVFMVFPIRLWEICFSFYLGRLSSAQWVPGRHLGAETWNLPVSGWAALDSMTHGDSMHSWAAFIGNQWLSHCRCPTSECPHSSSPPRCPCVFWSIPSQGEQEDYSIFLL